MTLTMEYSDYKLGIDSKLLQLESCDENREIATYMAQQASQTIDVISRLLDPPIFNSPDFIEAVKKLVTKSRKARVRIIVFDPVTIVRNGHRLVDLAGSLSSFIEIKNASHQYQHYSECLMIVDETAFLHRLNWDRYEATANFYDRRQSKYYQKEFEPMWETSLTDPNLRRISL